MKAEYELYLRRGWPLLPVTDRKLPAVKKWESAATTDMAQVEAWLGQDISGDRPLGCAVGRAGLMVIDVDSPDHGKAGVDGAASLRGFCEAHGEALPETFTVRTPTGGTHYYFRAPNLRGKNAFLPGVDVRACGGFVVAGGSVTERGLYEILDAREPAELPGWFAREYGRVKVEKVGRDYVLNVHVTPDSPEAVAGAEELLDGLGIVPEGERNDTLFRVMRDFCRLGVTRGRALEIYREEGVEAIGLDPDSAEVRATIDSAYSQEDFGADSAEARSEAARVAFATTPIVLSPEMEKLAAEAEEKRETETPPVGWNELAGRQVPPRRWFIEGWLSADPGYTVLLSGKGGTGKSMLMLDLMHSLATGEDFLGRPVLRGGRTLFVSCEDSEEDIARRIQLRQNASAVPENSAAVWPRWGRDNLLASPDRGGVLQPCRFLSVLEAYAAEFFAGAGGVLILDTISDIFAGNENDRSQVSQFVKRYIGGLGLRLGVTIVVLGHPGKGQQTTGNSYSGSTAWDGAFRCRWELAYMDPAAMGGPLVLTLAKSNSVQAGDKVFLRNDSGRFTTVDPVELDRQADEAVYQAICAAESAGNPHGQTPQSLNPLVNATIADPLTGGQMSKADISQALSRLMAEGKVVVKRSSKRNYLSVVEVPF